MSHTVPAATIKACEARIYWNSSHFGRVYDVQVRKIGEHTDKSMCCSGANSHAWLRAKDATPEAVFGAMLFRNGFVSPEEARIALLQFAKIDRCDWARSMLATKMWGYPA